MVLQSLRVVNFKNYETGQWSFSTRLNCLTGLNGVGKTNVLDAIYYLGLLKSHRFGPDRQAVRHGADFFRIEGNFQTGEDAEKATVVVKCQPNRLKVVERNGAAYPRLADHIGQFPVVMIAPDDLVLVQEGSEERRRFLDTTLSQMQPDYLHHLLLYNHLLRHRNALLKTFAEQHRFDAGLLSVYDQQMAAPAAALYRARREFVEAFAPIFQEIYAALSQGREVVALTFTADQTEQPFEALLREHAEKDRLLARTQAGPHRDDIDFRLAEQPLKRYGSQGQLKSFLLALRLAQYEVLRRSKGTMPILLLDDIFDKLDAQRVQHLVALLWARPFGQVFLTDTQRTRIEPIVEALGPDYALFELANS